MARLARVVAPGYPHHVTQRGNRRQKLFFCEEGGRGYIGLMCESCAKYGTETTIGLYTVLKFLNCDLATQKITEDEKATVDGRHGSSLTEASAVWLAQTYGRIANQNGSSSASGRFGYSSRTSLRWCLASISRRRISCCCSSSSDLISLSVRVSSSGVRLLAHFRNFVVRAFGAFAHPRGC